MTQRPKRDRRKFYARLKRLGVDLPNELFQFSMDV